MVLATQTLLQRRPKTYEVRVDGRLAPGVSAKDIILALIARIGIGGGTGHVFEYRGDAIRALTMEQRMTICNMSIEGGARAGLIAPDDTTFEYVARPAARAAGRRLGRGRRALADAADRRRRDATTGRSRSTPSALEPMVTYGTNPGMGIPITSRVPSPDDQADAVAAPGARAGPRVHGPPARPADPRPEGRRRLRRLVHERPDQRPAARGRRSCKDRKVADGVRMMIVPGLRRGEARGRARGPRTRSSGRPAPSGARRAARCASR